MSNITTMKATVSPVAGNPYVRDLGSESLNSFFVDILPAGRVKTPGAITAAAGVVTIPSGTVFLLALGNQLVKVELTGDVTVATVADDIVYLTLGQTAKGGFALSVGAAQAQPAGTLKLGTSDGADAFTLSTALDKATPKKTYLRRTMDINDAAVAYLLVPFACTVTKVSAVLPGAVTGTSVVRLMNTSHDVGTSRLSLTAGAAGDVISATPSGQYATFGAGSVLKIDCDGAATAALVVEITVELTQ